MDTTPDAPAEPYDAAVEPDEKDWTWVLRETCPECGFTAADVDPRTVPDLVPAQIAFWRRVLVDPRVSERPAPDVWSPLEYACHVRDVYDIFGTRVELIRDEDDPTFRNWDQDEAAVVGRSGEAFGGIGCRRGRRGGNRQAAPVVRARRRRVGVLPV